MAQVTAQQPASAQTTAAFMAVLHGARQRGYVISRLKMAKLLYFADLASVRHGDPPVSGVQWRWLNHGPFNNALLGLEDDLVMRGAIVRRPYFDGNAIAIPDYAEAAPYDLPNEQARLIDEVLVEFGRLAATTLKDLSYHTAPMVAAQKQQRGVVLDLTLEQPSRRVDQVSRRLRRALRSLPPQADDPGAVDELVREVGELAPGRGRATAKLLDDDDSAGTA